MIKIVKRIDINDKKWNEKICASPSFNKYVLTPYLDSVCYWDALIFNDYEWILPLPNNTKWMLKYVYMPPAIQFLDIYGTQKAPIDMYNDFLIFLKKHFFKIDIALQVNTDFKVQGYKIMQRKHQILNLNQPYSAIRSLFSNSHQRNIKKAEKQELIFTKSDFNEEVKSVLSHFYTSKKLRKINQLSSYFRLLDELILNKDAKIYVVKNKHHQIQNVSIFTFINQKYVNFNSINTIDGTKNGAMFFGLNEFIKENCNKDLILDFEGSNLSSIRKRNIGFGGEDKYYYHFSFQKI